jgi:hypothetical protein
MGLLMPSNAIFATTEATAGPINVSLLLPVTRHQGVSTVRHGIQMSQYVCPGVRRHWSGV